MCIHMCFNKGGNGMLRIPGALAAQIQRHHRRRRHPQRGLELHSEIVYGDCVILKYHTPTRTRIVTRQRRPHTPMIAFAAEHTVIYGHDVWFNDTD